MFQRVFPKWALAFVVLVGTFLWGSVASAYPWMIRHEYTGCSQCHVDPAGAGLLTLYGRAQSEVLLRTHYGTQEGEENPELGGFMFGLVKLPDQGVRAQFDGRTLLLHTKAPNAPAVNRLILMQADAQAGVELEHWRASVSLGYIHEGAQAASITRGENDRLISRQYWVGGSFGKDDEFMVRGGRMNLPYGLRMYEHTLWVRSTTGTDINDGQQHGVSFAYTGEKARAEIMAVAGNFQMRPDDVRERGYSAYGELVLSPNATVGVSSMILHTDYDLEEREPSFRQAHGVFARASPAKPVVILAEADWLIKNPKSSVMQTGPAAMLQVDVEPIQGLHVMGTGELLDQTFTRTPPSYGAWLSSQWFFLPHVDARIDAIWQTVPVAGSDRVEVVSLLGQLHVFL